MAVAFVVEEEVYEVGAASFLNSFFSTVFVRCEQSDWGSHFPRIMNDLYMGTLTWNCCDDALTELDQIQSCLSTFRPKEVIWDFENLEAKPPWGNEISSEITSLAEYWVTSDGKDLIGVMREVFLRAMSRRANILIGARL